KLTAQYKVMAYPTIVLLKSDGAELRRIIGFIEPGPLMSVLNDPALAKDAAARSSASATQAKADPTARMRAGELLAQQGKHREALDEFLWCFDHGKAADAAFHSARLSLLLNDMAQLGRAYPPATKALEQRRDSARQVLLSGQGGFDAASDFASLS